MVIKGFTMRKDASDPMDSPASDEAVDSMVSRKGGTQHDKEDMYRIGRDQELNVSLRTK